MTIREDYEKWEIIHLCKNASKSVNSKGREFYEKDCDLRTIYQRDRDRLIHSKAFRRLKHKTQVFISPEEDHYRTRLTHTLEVSQIARSIALSLKYNQDLVEAIALGHDLGHTPFGHAGEAVLNDVNPNGFKHNEQSIRVVKYLEKGSKNNGLNLSYEVLDGILNHSGDGEPITNEGKIVKLADRIAYINHDIDDAIRAGVLEEKDLPTEIIDVLGYTHSKRINTLIRDVILNSLDKDDIIMSPDIERAMLDLRQFMFDKVYNSPIVTSEEPKIRNIISSLYEYYSVDINRIPKDNLKIYKDIDISKDTIVTDYIASMTDRYAVHIWKEIYEPKGWL